MSLYADYLLEREGISVIESDNGFLSYVQHEDALYIVDVFVKPEARRTHEATSLESKAIEIARSLGLKKMMGSVVLNVNGVSRSLKMMIGSGYEYLSFDADKQTMFFVKDI